MESTGVYWKPVYYALEDLVAELWLCNAHHVKNVPGRKTDMADAEWLADVVAHGMLRPSLVPPPPIRALRNLTRYRKAIVDTRTKEKQRLEKVLQDAGIKLSSVASKIMTAAGRAMIEALIAGERDTTVLADMSMRKLRNKKAELEEALQGRFDAPHPLLASQILAHIDYLDGEKVTVGSLLPAHVAPYRAAAELCMTIPGIGAVVADSIVAEPEPTCPAFPRPAIWPPGPVWHQRPTSPPASAEPLAADTALRGYDGISSKPPKPRCATVAPTWPPNTARSPPAEVPTPPPSLSPTPSVWPSGTC